MIGSMKQKGVFIVGEYEYGNCPICDEPMMQMRTLFIWCPANEQIFNKTTLKQANMKISGVSDAKPEKWICQKHGTFESIIRKMEEADE